MEINILNNTKLEQESLTKQTRPDNAFSLTPDKQGKYSVFRVAIIDDFTTERLENLNIPHGKLVQKYISANLPGVQVEQKNITLNSGDNEKKLLTLLNNILKEIENGKNYDAINMSFQTNDFIHIDTLKINSEGKEILLTNENINKYRNKLKEMYKEKFSSFTKTIETLLLQRNEKEVTEEINNHFENLEKISQTIKKISEKGVKVFIANNNECASKIGYSDLFDIDKDYENYNNPNIITVSANDCKMSSSSLSDIKERSIFKFKFLKDGIDITDDGIIDIYDYYGIGEYMKENIGLDGFEGNSIATPIALAKFLKEKFDNQNK